MTKPLSRPYSRLTRHALALMGRQVRLGRKQQGMSSQELADRAGISCGLLQRIEKGDPGCQIGAAFEAAAIAGVRLFSSDDKAMAAKLREAEDKLTLLPKHTHSRKKAVDDAF